MKFTSISCVMSIYYGSSLEHFNDAFSSVLSQTRKPDEIIIIIDGPISQDALFNIKSIANNAPTSISITTHQLPINIGPGGARHAGILLAKSELIAIMDSDDIMVSNRFELQRDQFMKNPKLGLCGGFIQEFRDKTQNTLSFRPVPLDMLSIREKIALKSPFNNVTVMFRKKDYIIAGGYPELRTSEDYSLWARFIGHGIMAQNIKDVLVLVRFDNKSLLNRQGMKVFWDDYYTQKEILKYGLTSKITFIKMTLIYLIFRNLPLFIKKVLYKNVLRKPQ